MPTINQLSSIDELSSGDQIPVFSTSNGDARRASLDLLVDYIQPLLTSTGMISQYAAPNASGFSVLVNPTTNGTSMWLILTPNAGYAVGAITLPAVAACKDGQEVLVNSTQAVTALTVSGNGATVNGAPTALTANSFFRLKFDGVLKVWYRVG